MTKPVILLVDDDRAVLDALEGEVRAAFASVCRVEAFDSPEVALSLSAIWESEDRPVAVAVVDQKMPGMDGVEMLTRLRRSPAGRHACGVLLTGQSGLDAALAAINFGRAQRYVEKPWRPGAFREGLRYLLARHLAETGADLHYIFREATTTDDIDAVFRLRFEVHRAMQAIGGGAPLGSILGFDGHDGHSRHFGIFARDGLGEVPVGGFRIATGSPSPYREPVEAIERRLFRGGIATPSEPASGSLPCLATLAEPGDLRAFCERIRSRGETVWEPSRIVVRPEHRAAGMASWALESAIAVLRGIGIDHAIVSCLPSHARFYGGYGFVAIPGMPVARGGDGAPRQVLVASLRRLGADVHERIAPISERYAHRGAVCVCATHPACLGAPYASGEFGPTDLFCPVATSETLEAV